MFEKGEYVVYGSKGVCKIQDISHVDIPVLTEIVFSILCIRCRIVSRQSICRLTVTR